VVGWLDGQADEDYYHFAAEAGDTVQVTALPTYRPFGIEDIQFLSDGRLLLNCERPLSGQADLIALDPDAGELSVLLPARELYDAGVGAPTGVVETPGGALRFVSTGSLEVMDYDGGFFETVASLSEQIGSLGDVLGDESVVQAADGRIYGDMWLTENETAVGLLMPDGGLQIAVSAADLAAAGVGQGDYISRMFFDEDTEDLYLVVSQEVPGWPEPGRVLRVDGTSGGITTYLSQQQLQDYFGGQTVGIESGAMDQEGNFYFYPNLGYGDWSYQQIYRFDGSATDVWVTNEELAGVFEGEFGHIQQLAINQSGDIFAHKMQYFTHDEIALLGNVYSGAAPELVVGEAAWNDFSTLSGLMLEVTVLDSGGEELLPSGSPGTYLIETSGDYYLSVGAEAPADFEATMAAPSPQFDATIEYRVFLSGALSGEATVFGLAWTDAFLYGLWQETDGMAAVGVPVPLDEAELYVGMERPGELFGDHSDRDVVVGMSMQFFETVSAWFSPDFDIGPDGIAVVPAADLADRTILVADEEQLYSLSPVDWSVMGSFEVAGLFADTGGLCAASDGSVYATRDGIGVDHYGADGSLMGEFRHADLEFPTGIALSSDETTLYVVGFLSNEIFAFDRRDGTLVDRFGVPTVQGALDIEVGQDGSLYVLDYLGGRAVAWDPVGGALWEADLPDVFQYHLVALPDGGVGVVSSGMDSAWIVRDLERLRSG